MTENFWLKKRILWVILLILLFIWGNSLLPAVDSKGLSSHVKDLINLLLGRIFGLGGMQGDGLVRKLAHALEFAALGTAVGIWLYGRIGRYFAYILLLGLLSALIDETLQLYSNGRAGMIQDVWLDLGGFVLGVSVAWVFKQRSKS